MLRDEPFPGIGICGFCSCGLDAPDSMDCAGRSAAPLASSLLLCLVLASLELLDSLLTSGDECEGARGEAVRTDAGAGAGGANGSSARMFDVDGLILFCRRFGWLGDRLGGRAAALRFVVDRPACWMCRSSFASTYELCEEARDASGLRGAIGEAGLDSGCNDTHALAI
jgi:hypothetical protein